MESFLSVLRRDFEGFEPIKACEAALPIYDIKMTVEALEKQQLSIFALFFLRAIFHGKESLADIAEVLGVQERDLLSTGAQVLQLALIEQGMPDSTGKRLITLTDLGRKACEEQTTPPVPKRKICYLHFNALTWAAMPLEEDARTVNEICQEGWFVLPVRERGKPTLGDFTEKEVKQCLRFDSRFQKSTIVALLKLEKAEPQYLVPLQVFLLQHQRTQEQRIAVYFHRRQLREEEAELQRMWEEQAFVFPEEATLPEKTSLALPSVLPQKLLTTAETFVQNEERVQELTVLLDTEKRSQKTILESSARESSQEKVQQLTVELAKQRQELDTLRQQAAEERIEFVQTEQHREVLERALRQAREEIIIISPWMNPRTCNRLLCQLVGEAIARGVHIRIAYGFGKAEHPRNAAMNRNNVWQVKKAFEQAILKAKGAPHFLEMQETQGTHQKILICDRTFAVTGSFNWLSYTGRRDRDVREETSVLLRRKEDVQNLATIALRLFSS